MDPSHPKAPLDLVYASDDHFRTPRQTGLRGREFGPPDTDKSWYVAIVNEPAVRMLWPVRTRLGTT
jgi:hypothetical protein